MYKTCFYIHLTRNCPITILQEETTSNQNELTGFCCFFVLVTHLMPLIPTWAHGFQVPRWIFIDYKTNPVHFQCNIAHFWKYILTTVAANLSGLQVYSNVYPCMYIREACRTHQQGNLLIKSKITVSSSHSLTLFGSHPVAGAFVSTCCLRSYLACVFLVTSLKIPSCPCDVDGCAQRDAVAL